MSARGEITVECDVKGCYAEEHVGPEDAFIIAIAQHLLLKGWKWDWTRELWTCPQCAEDGKRA